MDALKVRPGSTQEPAIAEVIEAHFALMRATSPEESCHVMTAASLEQEQAQIFVAEADGRVLAVGALKQIAPDHGELKSMHTLEAARGRGAGRKVLKELVSVAQRSGFTRLSLETGSAKEFEAARHLYRTEGFAECPPFGDYVADPLSVFMTLDL